MGKEPDLDKAAVPAKANATPNAAAPQAAAQVPDLPALRENVTKSGFGDILAMFEKDSSPAQIDAIKRKTFGLLFNGNSNLNPLVAYCQAVPSTSTLLAGVLEVDRALTADRTGIDLIENSVASVIGGGSVPDATGICMMIYPRLTKHARYFLMARPLVTRLGGLPEPLKPAHEPDPWVSPTRALFQLLNGEKAGVLSKDGSKGKPPETKVEPKPEELAQFQQLKTEILAAIPVPDPKAGPPTVYDQKKAVEPAKFTELRGKIQAAPPVVGEMIAKDPEVQNRMINSLGADQRGQLAQDLDPIARLTQAINPPWVNGQPPAKKGDTFTLIHDFLVQHPGETNAQLRSRVLTDAGLLPQIRMLPKDQQESIQRMVVRGTDTKQPIDIIYEGKGKEALEAAIELSADRGQLAQLRGDTMFRQFLDTNAAMLAPAKSQGLEISVHDFMARAWGEEPNRGKDAALGTQGDWVDPNKDSKDKKVAEEANKPLTPEEWKELNAVVDGAVAKLAPRLETHWYSADAWTSDSAVVEALLQYERDVAQDKIKPLFTRANLSPGPELVKRANADSRIGDIRTKLGKCLGEPGRQVCERVLGIRADSAAVGQVNGKVRLADDKANAGKVPLPQALQEITVDVEVKLSERSVPAGSPLTQLVHIAAEDLARELNEWSADTEDVDLINNNFLAAFNAKSPQVAERAGLDKKDTSLNGLGTELLRNAFREVPKGGDLRTKIQEALGKAKGAEATKRMKLEPEDDRLRAQATQTPKEAAADKFDEKAAQLFAAFGRYSDASGNIFAEGVQDQSSIRRTSAAAVKNAYETAMAADPKAAPAPGAPAPVQPGQPNAAAPAPAASPLPNPATFKDFYQQKYGIDPQRHLVELARDSFNQARRAVRAANKKAADEAAGSEEGTGTKPAPIPEPTVAEFSEMFGLPPGAFDAATAPVAPPPELAKLDDANKQKANEGAKKLWDAVRGTGDVIQIRRELEKERREVQLSMLGIFRQLSGGIDLDFYIQQALGHHSNRIGGEGARQQGAEVAESTGARVYGEDSNLKETSAIAQTGTVGFLIRIDVALKNGNRDEIFRLADNATADERREVIASPKHMNDLRRLLAEKDFDRVYGVLNGSADLTTRLAARSEGSTVPWSDASDQKGMQRDIKDWVGRRTEQYIRDREDKKNTLSDEDIKATVTLELQRMYQDVALKGLIENEVNSWWNARGSASDIQSRLLNGGEEQHTSKFLNDGSWTSSTDILEAIKAMPAEERKKLRTNPQFLKKLDELNILDGDYRRIQIMRALQGTTEGDEGSLSAVHSALASMDPDKLLEAVSHLAPAELKRVQADPTLINRILNGAWNDPKKTAALRQMLTFDAASAQTGISGKNFTNDPIPGEIPPEEKERLAFLQHSAEARIRTGTFGTWEQLANEAIAVYKMNFKPVGRLPETPGAAPAPPDMNKNAKETHEQSIARIQAPTAADKHAVDMRTVVWTAVEADVRACVKRDQKKQFKEEDQVNGIKDGILGAKDPTLQLTQYLVAPGFWGDNSWNVDEDAVEKALTGASDQLIVDEWSSVTKPAFTGDDGRSLKDVYHVYRDTRSADTSKPETKAKMDAARLAYQRYVIQPSKVFEDLVLPGTRKKGGSETAPGMQPTDHKGQNADRDNTQYAKYRAIMNDRIKSINIGLVAKAIGADGHDAAALASGIRTAEQGLANATETHGQQRQSGSQAGDEGRQMDRALGDYNRAVQKSEDKTAGDRDQDGAFLDIPDRDKRENEKLDKEFGDRKAEFVEAREKAAELAALVVSVLVGVILTAVLPGAGSLAAAALYGALVSAAAATGQVLTKEAILGNTYDASGDGLKTIVAAAATGAIAGGAQFYGGQIVNALAPIGPTGTAAQQAAALAQGVATEAPMWRQILQEGGKGMVTSGITGMANTAGSMIDPTHWLHGWNEGWRRAKLAGAAEISKLPGDAVRMGLASMAGAFASKGAAKLGYPQGQPLKPGEIPGMTGVAKQFAADLPSNVGMALADNLMQAPATPGALAGSILQSLATNARDMKQGMDGGAVAHNLHGQQADAHVARQILAHQDRFVSGTEAMLFRQAVHAHAESGQLPTASEFLAARDVIAGASVKIPLTGEQADAFRRWVRKADTTAEFLARKERNPLEIPEVSASKPTVEHKRDASTTTAGSAAEPHATAAKELSGKSKGALGGVDALEAEYQKNPTAETAKKAFDAMHEHVLAAREAREGLKARLDAANEALQKAGTAEEKKELQAIVDEITKLFVDAQSAEAQIALARTQLNNAMAQEKVPGLNKKPPEPEGGDGKTKAPVPEAEAKKPPAIDTNTLSPEEYADFSIMVKELGPEKAAAKFKELQEKKQAQQAKGGAGEINASFIQGSDFIAQEKVSVAPDKIMQVAHEALMSSLQSGVIPGVKTIQKMGDDVVVELSNGEFFKINVSVTQLGPTALARSWMNTDRMTHVIQLNEKIAENNIRRATAHEIAELAVLHMQALGGAKPSMVDALAPGKVAPGAQLSGHDMGRIAEMNVLALDQQKAAGNPAELQRIRNEMFALAERLGLRGNGPDEQARLGMLDGKISAEARQLLDEARGNRVSPEEHDAATAFRQKSKKQEGLAEQALAHEQAIQKANEEAAKLPEGMNLEKQTGTTELSKAAKLKKAAQLKELNTQALARREAKHKQVWTELLGLPKDPSGEFYQLPAKFHDIQIGGNAAVAALSADTLFFDLPGRWHDDSGTEIAQTAGQLGNMPGFGDAHDFAGTNERVDLNAIRFMINDKAAKANCVNGFARIVQEGAHTLIEVHVGGEMRRFRMPTGTTPRVSTGFPRERFLGGGDPVNTVHDLRKRAERANIPVDPSLSDNYGERDTDIKQWLEWLQRDAPPPHVGKKIKDVLLDSSAGIANADVEKAQKEALDKNLGALDKWTKERAAHGPEGDKTLLQGDEANQTDYKLHPTTKWVIIGAGGTSISAAEIILKQTEARNGNGPTGTPPGPVTVKLVGTTDTASLRENTQWQELLKKYGPNGEGDNKNRLVIEGGRLDDFQRSADGKGYDIKDKNGKTKVSGEGLIVSIGRDPVIPPAFSDVVYTAELEGRKVEGQLLFDDVDNQYLGYRILVTGPDGTVQPFDVTGATSRFLPTKYFSPELRERVGNADGAIEQRDAPDGAGRFGGGFTSSANQALRYRLYLERLQNQGK